jgi:hypothetical protein
LAVVGKPALGQPSIFGTRQMNRRGAAVPAESVKQFFRRRKKSVTGLITPLAGDSFVQLARMLDPVFIFAVVVLR